MENYSTAASQGAAIKPNPPIQEHAQRLHKYAEELAVLSNRIESFCDRLTGPQPQSVGEGKDQPEPNGVLFVAQFGATRIQHGLDRLREITTRLESIA